MNTKVVSIVMLVVFLLTVIVGGLTKISITNNLADAEVLVVTAKDNCAVVRQEGINSLLEVAQVDKNTKEYLVDFMKSATPAQTVQVNDSYAQLVSGNPQPFMLLMSSLSGTNITVTSENLQREIVSQRANMKTCAVALNSSQQQLKKIAGLNSAGETVKFPQKYLGLDAPSTITDPYLQDNDGDGRLTVLDYRAPVSLEILQSFGSVPAVIEPLNLYGD